MSTRAASAKPLSLQRSNCIFSQSGHELAATFRFSQGLYHPPNEHDACGVGFVAHIKGKKSHTIVEQGLDGAEEPHATAARSAGIRSSPTAPAC